MVRAHKKRRDFEAHVFLVEQDFHGKEKEQVMFDSKEEAFEAYLRWEEKKDFS